MIVKKYTLLAQLGPQSVLLPSGRQVMSFQVIAGDPVVFMLADAADHEVATEVLLTQTATELGDVEYRTCVGTAIDAGVEWHLFYPRTP